MPPLRSPEIFRLVAPWPVDWGDSDVALRRGLNASTLAPLCRSNFSSGDSVWGSLLERKLVPAEFEVGRRGRKRSRDLSEPLERTLSLD